VTAARREALARIGVRTVEDLLRTAPRRYEDRRHPVPVERLEPGTTALVIGTVVRSKAFRVRGGLSVREATVEDATGAVTARWFLRGFLARPLPEGEEVALYGPVRRRGASLELASPALERLAAGGPDGGPGAGRIVPVHPLAKGLSAPLVRRAVWEALPAVDRVPDALPRALVEGTGLPSLAAALRGLHFPDEIAAAEGCRRRLAYEELVLHEIRLAVRRRARALAEALPVPFPPRVHERIRARLPFRLTAGQERAVAEIVADMERPHPMNRLLQGDVGSGKTLVAAYAMLGAVARGLQAAFMAPTEVLARQHEATLRRLLEGSRVRIEALAGGARGTAREAARRRVAVGEADLVVGTHAVLSRDVSFRRLGLVVVDEQHKFGVLQRSGLVAKGTPADGALPHCLVMTATPIPRTLALAVYGDLDVSVIEGTIPGRSPVETLVVRPREGARVLDRVRRALAEGRQAFVVYPLVEESDRVGLRDAVLGRERWAKALPGRRVGLLHGRMTRDAKARAMDEFRAGRWDVLVATVVVEVGVDVPNATVLVVEHAERFGLSQLHQLRGRVGRGGGPSLCVLVDRSGRGTPARLGALAATADGFRIAEEDLRLRGVGDLLGTRQHGSPGFAAARLPEDLPLLLEARRAVRDLLARDPALAAPEHLALRIRALGVRSGLHAPGRGGALTGG
jgi:ATP-dependent DNA helicase RecG